MLKKVPTKITVMIFRSYFIFFNFLKSKIFQSNILIPLLLLKKKFSEFKILHCLKLQKYKSLPSPLFYVCCFILFYLLKHFYLFLKNKMKERVFIVVNS